MVDDLNDDDPTDVKFQKYHRRFTDHVIDSRKELDEIHRSIGVNTNAVIDLDDRFRLHDAKEVQYRESRDQNDAEYRAEQKQLYASLGETMKEVAKAIHEVSLESKLMREDFAKYQARMKPAENAVTWVRFTQGFAKWIVGVAAAIVAIKLMGADFIKWLGQ